MNMQLLGLVAIGLIGIAFVALLFWPRKGRTVTAHMGDDGVQQVEIEVATRAFEPGVIHVAAGYPVRLVFHRGPETPWCTGRLHVLAFGKKVGLDPDATASIEFQPDRPGTFEFTCFRQKHRGRIVAT